MKTNIYVGGFNLYYACLKRKRGVKRLDLRALGQALFPFDTIHRVKFCTAIVKGESVKAARQELYHRALREGAKVIIPLGHHEERPKNGLLQTALPCQAPVPCVTGTPLVNVVVREEKGSDVNLAAHLLRDAFLKDFDQAVVISNDSDLVCAIQFAKLDAGLPVHVISPHSEVVGRLRKAATSARPLDRALVVSCQLPNPVKGKAGVQLWRPTSW